MFIYIDISMFIASKSFTTGLLNFLTFNLIFYFFISDLTQKMRPLQSIYIQVVPVILGVHTNYIIYISPVQTSFINVGLIIYQHIFIYCMAVLVYPKSYKNSFSVEMIKTNKIKPLKLFFHYEYTCICQLVSQKKYYFKRNKPRSRLRNSTPTLQKVPFIQSQHNRHKLLIYHSNILLTPK